MFSYYYIICRSLTYAQRTAAALEKAGVHGSLLRAPKGISAGGCSYAVRIPANRLNRALTTLKEERLSPVQVFLGDTGGEFREVDL